MKWLKIILVYISLMMAAACAGPMANSPETTTDPTAGVTVEEQKVVQKIKITNNWGEKVIYHLERIACRLPMADGSDQKLAKCPKGAGELAPGESVEFDISDEWKHTFAFKVGQMHFYYELRITAMQPYEDIIKFHTLMIEVPIGVSGELEAFVREMLIQPANDVNNA